MSAEGKKRFWVSWWHDQHANGSFELFSPWWVSGGDLDGRDTICAAVLANDEDHAMERIYAAYDRRPGWLSFRFVERRPGDWSPWNVPKGTSRFQKAAWMDPYWPADAASEGAD